MSKKDELFNELSDLVWNHALMMDSNGNTGPNRNIEETAKYWNQYHDIVDRYRKEKYGRNNSMLQQVKTFFGYIKGRKQS